MDSSATETSPRLRELYISVHHQKTNITAYPELWLFCAARSAFLATKEGIQTAFLHEVNARVVDLSLNRCRLSPSLHIPPAQGEALFEDVEVAYRSGPASGTWSALAQYGLKHERKTYLSCCSDCVVVE